MLLCHTANRALQSILAEKKSIIIFEKLGAHTSAVQAFVYWEKSKEPKQKIMFFF